MATLWRFLTIFCAIFGLMLVSSCRENLGNYAPYDLRFDQDKIGNLYKVNKRLSRAVGLRMMWWNVAWGSFNGAGDLNHNLVSLLDSDARPDVLILGEFKTSALSDHANERLNFHYPHRYFLPYSPSDIVGVQVYSIKKLEKIGSYNLPWYPISMRDSREQKNYQDEWHKKSPSEARYWDRSVQLLAYQYAGKKYVLAPVHLLEPWAAIATSGSKAEKLKNIVFDNNNPLKHQVDHLRNVLKYKIGNVENVVLIGDFNIPSRFYGLTPSIYNFLTAGFKEVFSGNPNTFPAKSAGDRVHGIFKALSIKIDHTFIGNGIDRIEADVLHLKGSDHYPIYVVVAPKKAGFWSWF